MTGPKGRPLRAGTSVNDIMGGMFGAIGVLAALRERDRTGKGQEIQSALFENCVFLSAQHMQQYAMTGEAPPPMPSRVSAWSVYDVFELADGEQLFIGAVSDKQFKTLCDVLERPDLADDPALRPTRSAWRAAQLLQRLGETLKHHKKSTSCRPSSKPPASPTRRSCAPSSCWTTRTCRRAAASCRCRPKRRRDRVVLLPLMLGGRRPGVRRPLPRVGEHTEEVLAR